MIHKLESYMNTSGIVYTFSFLMFILVMFAFEFSEYDAFAQDQPSPFDGMNFSKSQDVYSKDGVLQTAISADYKMGVVDNQSITSMVYNGSLTGPTLHLYPGDRLELDFINNLNETTNLHFHGIHASPANNSDNVFIDVEPGETQHYTVDIPKDHHPGTLWYHSHEGKGIGTAYGQVSAGLSGLFIIEGTEKLLPEPLRNITKQAFAIRDFPFDQLFVTTHKLSDTNTGSERITVNGEINPDVNIASGETQLWRFANIGPENEYEIALPNHTFHVIAEDGSPVWEVWNNDTLFLPSGKRFDVLVTATGNGSIPLNNTFGLGYYHDNRFATINIQGNQKDVENVNIIPTSLRPREDLNNANIANYRVLNFSSNDKDWIYKINNQTFDHNRIDQTVKLGTVEEWKLVNLDDDESGNIHPFHIHVNDFQVMSVNGKPYHARGLQDTVILPTNGEVVIRIPFEDFVGKSVYHCHLMFHGDFGMMGIFEVVK
jgi:suppressor of ftsI